MDAEVTTKKKATRKERSPLWWISWEQDGDDSRPVKWPPPPCVLAFWESGIGDGYTTVVALACGREAAVRHAVESAWNPGVRRWRFFKEHRTDAPGDRFPAPDWSVKMGRWPWECRTA